MHPSGYHAGLPMDYLQPMLWICIGLNADPDLDEELPKVSSSVFIEGFCVPG